MSPLPNTDTPSDHARDLSSRCKGFPDATGAKLLVPGAVESVEADYAHVPSGNGTEARLQGARIHLKTVDPESPESMTRNLECHQASATLGKIALTPDDPYALPGAWLDIDVHSEGDGFVARVRGKSFEEAREVLARSRRFAAIPPSK